MSLAKALGKLPITGNDLSLAPFGKDMRECYSEIAIHLLGSKIRKMANLYSRKDLFTTRHSIWEEKKQQKPAQKNHIWLVVVL